MSSRCGYFYSYQIIRHVELNSRRLATGPFAARCWVFGGWRAAFDFNRRLERNRQKCRRDDRSGSLLAVAHLILHGPEGSNIAHRTML